MNAQRLTWWLPSKAWADDGWRWRVATLLDKLPGQCWCDLVEWALRRHEDDPDTPWNDFVRRVPLRRQTDSCRDDALAVGACYCSKVRTAEADADMCSRGAKRAAVIVRKQERQPAPEPSPAEQQEIKRFGIFAEEQGQ